jgi:hypothetical protein
MIDRDVIILSLFVLVTASWAIVGIVGVATYRRKRR